MQIEEIKHPDIQKSTSKVHRKKKKLILQGQDFTVNCNRITQLCDQLPDGVPILQGKRKPSRNVDGSFRRSGYIGVSRNGPNWQSLISIRKRKTYIGTFATQEEAAQAFDMYAILMNNLTAVTNYDYTKQGLLKVVADYQAQRVNSDK